MPINIQIDEFTRVTIKWFVMRYLFEKAKGRRTAGEEYTQELYRGWLQVCVPLKKKGGTITSFGTAMRRMREAGIIELAREETSGETTFPRRYYILTSEYFDYMVAESAKVV